MLEKRELHTARVVGSIRVVVIKIGLLNDVIEFGLQALSEKMLSVVIEHLLRVLHLRVETGLHLVLPAFATILVFSSEFLAYLLAGSALPLLVDVGVLHALPDSLIYILFEVSLQDSGCFVFCLLIL